MKMKKAVSSETSVSICLIHTVSHFRAFEYGDSGFLRNVGTIYLIHTVSHFRRPFEDGDSRFLRNVGTHLPNPYGVTSRNTIIFCYLVSESVNRTNNSSLTGWRKPHAYLRLSSYIPDRCRLQQQMFGTDSLIRWYEWRRLPPDLSPSIQVSPVMVHRKDFNLVPMTVHGLGIERFKERPLSETTHLLGWVC